ncbi:hypothetical protein EU557_00845 [Hymenobacter wooponensis]|uniref:Uncharacterized protein n=1 Tax=Hymenobacter wooponensis TaxID=1525360 RepID=A0A4Z0MSQ4_9BACT|nr:hypothetical protein EU557_00845 [Hymenobacter wooponensis]
MTKKVARSKNGFGFIDYVILTMMLGIFYLFASKLVEGSRITQKLDSEQTSMVIGHINSDKGFFGNSPVSRQFYYRYFFTIGTNTYWGDSRNADKRPGDTLLVRYYIPDPTINEPAN